MKKPHIVCALVALFFSSAFCYSLSFYLFDAKTNREISGTILMVGNGLNLSVDYTVGNSDAFNIAAGTYTFTFSAPGYKDSTVTANLANVRSFSIGLKAFSSTRFNNRSHMQTPFNVHYDKHLSVLHITGNNPGHGISAVSLFTISGRKVFAINCPWTVSILPVQLQ